MASMRDIKRRVKSVSSTQQITKAMNLVAASKLQKSKNRLVQTRPFFSETQRVIASIVSSSKGISHKFLDTREAKNSLIIVLTGDKGLCGGYNANISKLVYQHIRKHRNEQKISMITVGGKAKDYFKRRKVNIIQSHIGISESPFYDDADEMSKKIIDMYADGEVDEIYLAYTEFKSTITHEPKMMKLLPLSSEDFVASEEKKGALMNYDPGEEEVLDYIIPKYITTLIFGALLESSACEQGARMTSMDSATENAEKMIDSYTLLYNRIRQGAITQEINEIVSGANALN